jgi:dienelactone hydrolase
MVIQAYQHHPEPGEETRIGITGHCHGTDLAAAVAHTADPLQDLEAKQEEHKGGGEEEDVLHRQAHFPLLIMSQQLQRGRSSPCRTASSQWLWQKEQQDVEYVCADGQSHLLLSGP